MEQHVGIIGIRHGAGALFALDAAAQRGHCLPAPERGNIIVVVAYIADGLGTNAAAPEIAIGRDMGAGPTGITGNGLCPLMQHPFGQLIVLGAKGLGKARNAFGRRLARLLTQKISNFIVICWPRGNAPADGVQFYPFFRYFGDIAIGLEEFEPFLDRFEAVRVKTADDRVNGEHQIFVDLLEFLQPLPGRHREFPVALDAANVIMLVADAVEAQVDADAAGGAFPAHAIRHRDDALGQHAVGGDRNDFGFALLVGADDQFIQIWAQKGFTAGEGHIKGRVAQAGKDLFPLVDGKIIVGFAPDVTGAAFAVAAKADADDDRKGFNRWPAKGAKGPVKR